jgi:hypothetical protein
VGFGIISVRLLVTVREGYIWNMFRNKELRRVFVLRKDQGMKDCRKFYNKQFHLILFRRLK